MDKNNALKLVDRIWYRCEEIEKRPTDGYRMLPDIMELKEEIRSCSCSRWIPVSERLPEYGGYVLAVFEKCLPFVAMYYSGVKKFSCEGEEANPTHWMPLPEPPQEVE